MNYDEVCRLFFKEEKNVFLFNWRSCENKSEIKKYAALSFFPATNHILTCKLF